MTMDLMYIFTALIAVYYGIKIYVHTQHKIILFGVSVLLSSVVVKLRWLNAGDYLLDITGTFWAIIDIARAILIIYISKYTYRLKK